MSRSSPGGRGGLRTLALVAAAVIALASTAVVVLSDDKQTLRLAVVGALWAFVLAALAAPRRRQPETPAGDTGAAQELRRTYEAELEKEVAARREYELQLEVYLRRELESGLAEDVAGLRDEVARLRGEMIDRLDGELQMERIQSNRLIGGSLRALRDEARRFGLGVPVPPELAADHPPDPVGRGSGNGSGEYGPPGSGAPNSPPGDLPPDRPGQGGASLRPQAGPSVQPGGPSAQPGPPPQPGPQPGPPQPGRPVPRSQAGGDPLPRHRRRSRDDGEDNEVMSRLLGR